VTIPGVSALDVAYALSVAGVAIVFPPAALIVAAGYFLLSWYLTDQRTPPAEPKP
jgi:hypothetical protein